MKKSEAIYNFWNSFGVSAYDESYVPDNTPFPYITYNYVDDEEFIASVSVWDKSYSWARVSDLVEQIGKRLGEKNYTLVPFDGGYFMLYQEHPFSQRMSDEDQTIRRAVLNVGGKRLARY